MGDRQSELDLTRDIVEAIRGGDRAAFDDLFRRVGGRIFVYVASRMKAPLRRLMEPEDLLQEVYVEAYKSFPTFVDQGPGSFARWMVGIAANVVNQAYKHHFEVKQRDARRQVTLGPEREDPAGNVPTPDPTPSRIVARNEQVRKLAEALASLDEEDREVILLRVFEGLHIEEVARRVSQPRTTVAYRLARGLSRLEARVPDLNTVW